MFQAVCPTCRQKAVPPFHKIAATVDTLVPAQCANCKAYSTVPPERIAWLGFPELSALPVGALVFFVTERLYLAFGVGVLVYCAAVVIGVSRAPYLRSFLKTRPALPASGHPSNTAPAWWRFTGVEFSAISLHRGACLSSSTVAPGSPRASDQRWLFSPACIRAFVHRQWHTSVPRWPCQACQSLAHLLL